MNKAPKPLKGHPYHSMSDDSLYYIINDAQLAAANMRDFNAEAEAKYLDQINDAYTVLSYRTKVRNSIKSMVSP